MWPILNLNLNGVRVSGCEARVQWLPPSAVGEARGQHRPMPAGAEGQGEGRDGVTTVAAVGQVWLVEAAQCVSSQLQVARSVRAGAAH